MQGAIYKQVILPINKVLKVKKDTDAKISPIISEINEVTAALDSIHSKFDFETNPDMIDACIYEERALLSRYRHLILLAKQYNINCSIIERRMV